MKILILTHINDDVLTGADLRCLLIGSTIRRAVANSAVVIRLVVNHCVYSSGHRIQWNKRIQIAVSFLEL